MGELLSRFLHSDVANGLGLLFGLLAVLLAVLLFRWGRRVKVPCWAIRNNVLIKGYSSTITDLEVKYKGSDVENLSIARVAFWNDGSDPLDGRDVAVADPLKIAATGEGVTILDAKVVATNHGPSQFTARPISSEVVALAFDYLGRDHGAVIQIVHTGTSRKAIAVVGSIKGVDAVRLRTILVMPYLLLPTRAAFDEKLRPRTKLWISAITMWVLSAVFMVVIVLSFVFARRGAHPSTFDGVFLAYCAVLAVFGGLVGLRLVRRVVPKGLEAIEETFP